MCCSRCESLHSLLGAILLTHARSYHAHLAPVYPVVPLRLFEPEHFPLLLQEPILLAAICLVASRFHDLGPSFDVSEPARSRVVQGKLVAWVIARLGYLTMGE